MSKTHTHFDIIVVGMGLVGASFVLALQKQGFKVACLEQRSMDFTQPIVQHSRPISLSYSSLRILKTLGVWEKLDAFSAPIQSVHVSTQGALGRLKFEASEFNLEHLGAAVPFALLERVLYQAALEDPQLKFIPIEALQSVQCSASGAELLINTAEGIKNLRAEVLVAADGTDSSVRELLHINSTRQDFQEVGFTAILRLNQGHQAKAYERFTPEGSFALLPLQDPKSYALVWTMSQALWQQRKLQSDLELLTVLQNAFGYRVGKIKSLTRMAQYPLSAVMAETQIHPGAVLIGNAAHSLYPLAAQGFNLGLRDAANLAECFVAARTQQKSLGELSVLENYDQQRKQDQHGIRRLIDHLHTSFSVRIPGFNALRAAALFGIDILPPLKKSVSRRCLGLAGRLSRLARGLSLDGLR